VRRHYKINNFAAFKNGTGAGSGGGEGGDGGGGGGGGKGSDRHTVILFFIQSASAADPPCVSQKMGNKGKLDNVTGKWDLQKANLHMYKFAMTRKFLAVIF
jgi:hypothetical protein